MKRLLLVLVAIAVAMSGCTEKGPSDKEAKTAALSSADSLSSYSLHSFMNQTLKLGATGASATPENTTTFQESSKTSASVNLTSFQAKASGSTSSLVKQPGLPENTSTTKAQIYQIGNSTFVLDERGQWIRLQDPRSAEEIWGQGMNNQIKAMSEMINGSKIESVGSEKVDGLDAYKWRIVTSGADYQNLYNTAFGIAAKLTQYPLYVPAVNSTELNASSKMEKLIWISKESRMPVKYQNHISFKMTPVIIGGMDRTTGQIKMFNQSLRQGEISVDIETTDTYYGFNKPVDTALPEDALKAEAILPAQVQAASPA